MTSTFRACAVALGLVLVALAPAGLASAQTITPPSTAVVATSTNFTMTAGGLSLTCSGSTFAFTTPAAGGLPSVSTAGTNVTYTGCKALGGLIAATITVGPQPWTATITKFLDAPKTSWEFSITMGQLTLVFSTGCVLTVAVGKSITGVYTNVTTSYVLTGSVPFTSNGVGPGCPPSGSATISGSYTIKPSMSIT